MPQPQPQPPSESRRRAYRACFPCKASKKRCDEQIPCGFCLGRRDGEACTYPPPTQRRRRLGRPMGQVANNNSPAAHLSDYASSPRGAQADTQSQDAVDLNDQTDSPVESVSPGQTRLSSVNGTLPPSVPSARVLQNSKGERMYMGKFASLSFLEFMRRVFKTYAGSTPFTHNELQDVMLESGESDNSLLDFMQHITRQLELVDSGLSALSGVLDLFSAQDLEKLKSPDHERSKQEAAVFDIVLAIGAQSSNSGDRRCANSHFNRGRSTAFEDMLETSSLDVVKLFLLMAFYMLGACRRNTAFTYVGVAARVASSLGLDVRDQYMDPSRNNMSIGLRIWKSLCNMHVLITSLLGRGCTSLGVPLNSFLEIPHADSGLHSAAVHSMFHGCCIIQEAVESLIHSPSLTIDQADRHLDQLATWSQGLPAQFCGFFPGANVPILAMDKPTAITNIHIACLNDFAIILITRPFLIRSLMTRLSQPADVCPDNNGNARLARTCVDAAVHMAQMCDDATSLDLLVGNMCILKPWVFSAGLVLAFFIFVEDEIRFSVGEAFYDARATLDRFAPYSLQAKHYYDTLTDVAISIKRYRRPRAWERRNQDSANGVLPSPMASLTELACLSSLPGPKSSGQLDIDVTNEVDEMVAQTNVPCSFINSLENWDILDVCTAWDFSDAGIIEHLNR